MENKKALKKWVYSIEIFFSKNEFSEDFAIWRAFFIVVNYISMIRKGNQIIIMKGENMLTNKQLIDLAKSEARRAKHLSDEELKKEFIKV